MPGGGEGSSGHHGLPGTGSVASGDKGRPSQAALGTEGNPPIQGPLGAEGNLPSRAQGRGQAPVGNKQPSFREQDRFMPIANVIRIMRKVLPTHAKISDDAKETIQECVSEFISFITSEANERCRREQRKTIMAEDLLWAMSKLGFDDYIEPLSLYLQRYREQEGDNRGSLLRGPDPLTIMKHRNLPSAIHHPPNPLHHSGIGNIDAPQHFNPIPLQPPPNFVIPPTPTAPHNLYQPGLYGGDGMAGNYYGMYGKGSDGAGSSSSQAPGMPGFDHGFPPHK